MEHARRSCCNEAHEMGTGGTDAMISSRQISDGLTPPPVNVALGAETSATVRPHSQVEPNPLQNPSAPLDQNVDLAAELAELRRLRSTAGKVAHELNNVMTVLYCRSAQLALPLQAVEGGERILIELETVLGDAALQVRALSQACRNCDLHSQR